MIEIRADGCLVRVAGVVGYQHENYRAQIRFPLDDVLDIVTENPGGSYAVVYKRMFDEQFFTSTDYELDGAYLIWNVSSHVVAVRGELEVQIVYSTDQQIAETQTFHFKVARGLMESEEGQGENLSDLIEQALLAAGTVDQAIYDAQQTLDEKVTAAQTAQTAAESAQTAAERAQHTAENAKTSAAQSANAAYNYAADANRAKRDAVTAKDNAVQAKGDAELAKTAAETAEDNANTSALKSEGYAVGTQNGTPAGSGEPYYQDNAKYYKEQAAAAKTAAEAARDTAQQTVAGIEAAGTAQVQRVNAEGATQVGNVQTKGQQVLDSIPADYTQLSENVDELKSTTDALCADVVANQAITLEQGTWSGRAKATSATNLRSTELIPVKAGQIISFDTSSLYFFVKIYESETTSSTPISTSVLWTNHYYPILVDGLAAITVSNSEKEWAQSAITPSECTTPVLLINSDKFIAPDRYPVGSSSLEYGLESSISSADVNRCFVPSRERIPVDGKTKRIRFFHGINSAEPMPAKIYHFRPNATGSSYTEVNRYEFPLVANQTREFDFEVDVKAGDLFGCNTILRKKTAKNGEFEFSPITYSDDPITFDASTLSTRGYVIYAFDIEFEQNRNINEVNQSSLSDGKMKILRNADIEVCVGKNLLNKNNVTTGAFVSDDTFVGAKNHNCAIIPVEANTVYCYNHDDGLWAEYEGLSNYISFLDNSLAFIQSLDEKNLMFTVEGGKQFRTPSNCAYVVINLQRRYGTADEHLYTNTMQVEKGSHNTVYEPFTPTVQKINGVELPHPIVKTNEECDAPINLYILGDSIATPGLGHWYGPMIKKYSFKYVMNIANGGATYTHSSDTSEDTTLAGSNNVLANQVNILINGVENLNWPEPEVVFVYLGINDRGKALDGDTGLNYGDPDTAFAYADDYSSLAYNDAKLQNLCGAFRFSYELLWRHFPYCKIHVATPMYTGNPTNAKVRALNTTIKACASWMGIPVMDLAYESYVYQQWEKPNSSTKYLIDTLHPNDTGGKLLADKIAHYLISWYGGKEYYHLADE